MKLIITRPTRADGKSFEPSDKPVEVSADAAKVLLGCGKAKPAPKAKKTAPADPAT